MPTDIDEQRLDDPHALAAADPAGMLRATATGAAQVRAGAAAAAEAGLADVAAEGRPRSLVVCGMGGSGIAGELLAAALGPNALVPVVVHRDAGIPGWVGATDLVIGVSCSGRTQETLSAVDEARRRSARLVGVGSEGSDLADLVVAGRGVFIPVRPVLAPRASLWGLATPLFSVCATLGLLDLGGPSDGPAPELPEHLEAAADRLEHVAVACGPEPDTFVNPAKELALALADGLPLIWGSGQCGPPAATRLACQLAENAKSAAVSGALPEVLHNQVVAFDGVSAVGGKADFFRDRVDEPSSQRARLCLLRDDEGDARSARAADVAEQLANERGLQPAVIRAEGASPIERLASLIGIADFASVYVAVLKGVDPTPVAAIDEVKARSAGPIQ